MGISNRSARPVIEACESRIFMSAAAVFTVPALGEMHASAVHVKHHATKLHGKVVGQVTAVPGNPDTGASSQLTGQGTLGKLGAASIDGTLSLPGFIAVGRASGTLTVTTSTGTLTLSLSGPMQKSHGPLPKRLTYVITGGTGAFATATGKGRIALVVASDNSLTMKFR